MRRRALRSSTQLASVVGVLGALLAGCGEGGPSRPAAPPSGSEQARAIHARACARCHAPPEPMRHTRGELEDIFVRHRTRARLTSEQWQAMVDFLARPDETPGPR